MERWLIMRVAVKIFFVACLGARNLSGQVSELLQRLIRLAAMANKELREMVETLNREFVQRYEHIQLRYSDALARADLSRVELFHPIDDSHAFLKGHNILAEATFTIFEQSWTSWSSVDSH
jgi:hypothetical protein